MVQMPEEQQGQNPKRLLPLKLAIFVLYVVFVALVATGEVVANNLVTLAGLVCFTAALAMTTYYVALTQS